MLLDRRSRHEEVRRALELVEWRRRYLRARGLEPSLALALALDFRVDLHALAQMLEEGWQPELAARVLAPAGGLEDGRG